MNQGSQLVALRYHITCAGRRPVQRDAILQRLACECLIIPIINSVMLHCVGNLTPKLWWKICI